jgi:hypothetical protein
MVPDYVLAAGPYKQSLHAALKRDASAATMPLFILHQKILQPMASMPKSNEIDFIKRYYNLLAGRSSNIQQYYSRGSQLTIAKEQGTSEVCTKEFHRYMKQKIEKPISKILVTHVSYQALDEMRSFITVVGQFVYTDNTQSRVSHHFIVLRADGSFCIQNEILTLLDETVVYEDSSMSKRSFVLGYDGKKMSEAIECVSGYGEVEAIECREGQELLVTFKSADDVESLRKKGAQQDYRLEFDNIRAQ